MPTDLSPVPSTVPSEYDEEYDDEEYIEEADYDLDGTPEVIPEVETHQPDVDVVLAAYTAAIAAIDDRNPHSPKRGVKGGGLPARPPTRADKGPATLKRNGRKTKKTGGNEPEVTVDAQVRCAVRVGTQFWAAERGGYIVVRCAQSGKFIDRILPHGWEQIWSITPVGPSHVWCGTESGPILVFDKGSRKLVRELHKHAGGVHCIAQAPASASRGFVCSGGADWKLIMWSLDGKFIRSLAGHTGGVRCVLVLGMSLWTGSDDGSVRVWDAAYGLFQLSCEPCRAVLTGHTGAVHCLLTHSSGVLSSGADGVVRCWKAGGTHECLREAPLECGPAYAMVPMGKLIWCAAHDGVLHAFDGASLEVVEGGARRAHAGFVSGLCALPARTTRQCWSYSTADGKLCRWRTDEIEAQLTSEQAASLSQIASSLESQLASELKERAAEQSRHAAEREADAARLAQMEEALAAARATQQQLLCELSASMELQEADVLEAERLRKLLVERDAHLAERDEALALLAAQAEALRAAEASAREQAADVATQLDGARELLAQSGARLRAAEDMARRKIGAAVRTWRQRRDCGEAAIGIATRPMGDIDVLAPLEQAAEVEQDLEELKVKRTVW